jgi:hypothetical protein
MVDGIGGFGFGRGHHMAGMGIMRAMILRGGGQREESERGSARQKWRFQHIIVLTGSEN